VLCSETANAEGPSAAGWWLAWCGGLFFLAFLVLFIVEGGAFFFTFIAFGPNTGKDDEIECASDVENPRFSESFSENCLLTLSQFR
jgi:hypothetical protein